MYAPPNRDKQHSTSPSRAEAANARQDAEPAVQAFAPAANLTRLQALMHNSANATAQLKIPPAMGRGVVQLAGAKVSILAPTHLVAPRAGSLLNGRKKERVQSTDKVRIDPNDTEQSARGPDHKKHKNSDTNRESLGKKNYKWFKVLKLNGAVPAAARYLREETFIYEKKKRHLKEDSVDAGLSTKIKSANKEDAYVKAHGLGSVAEIMEGQRTYQDWLKTAYPDHEDIMDMHRSVGFEYEFATFKTKSGKPPGIPAHVKLGESAVLSPLFNMRFMLESDDDNELEAVTPPFLVADSAGGINAGAANRIYLKYKNSLESLRDRTPIDTKLTSLDFSAAGLGDAWSFTGPMRNLYKGARQKHKDSSINFTYSQMNISMTAEEIADYTDKRSLAPRPIYKAVLDAFSMIRPALESKRDAVVAKAPASKRGAIRTRVNAAIVNLSKGLSGLVTIPSILARNEGINDSSGLFSYVKEYCGMWLKDSIPNIVDNTLGEKRSRKAMRAIIRNATADITDTLDTAVDTQLAAMKSGVKEWFDWPFRKSERADEKLAGYRAKYSAELTTTLDSVRARLKQDAPELEPTPPAPAYGKEKFGDKGLGVRKDTFVNIKSGKNRALHLAELRNAYAIDELLGVGRRQR